MGTDMFKIVTQKYDLDEDGTYETSYDYQTITLNFDKTAQLQLFYDSLTSAQQGYWQANISDSIMVIVTWADNPFTEEIENGYNYAAFTSTFNNAYQLQQFYNGLSISDSELFEDIYGTDMFKIVTQKYDLDGDGTYETSYDYQIITLNFDKTAQFTIVFMIA